MKSIKDSKSSSSKENQVIEKKVEVYKCDQCKFSSEREITQSKHKNTKHVKNKFDDCGHSFKSASKLESHKKRDHLKTTQKGKITENQSNVDKRQETTQEADENQTSFENGDVSDMFQKEKVDGECLELCNL